MEVTAKDGSMPLRELVLVNAQRGSISLHFNQVDMGWSASGASSSLQQDTHPTATPEPTKTPVVSETPEPLATALPVIEDAGSPQAEGQTIESAELSGNLYVANTGNRFELL